MTTTSEPTSTGRSKRLAHYRDMHAAERAFQAGVESGEWEYAPERAAHTWVEAGFNTGKAVQKLDDMMELFHAELVACGMPRSEATTWSPEDVSGLEPGAELHERR